MNWGFVCDCQVSIVRASQEDATRKRDRLKKKGHDVTDVVQTGKAVGDHVWQPPS